MTTLLMIKRTVLSNTKMTVRYPMAANLRGLDKTLLVSLVIRSSEDDSHEMANTKFAQMMTKLIEEGILASDKSAKFGVLPINRCVKTYSQYPIKKG